MTKSLSKQQARKLVLLSQRLPPSKQGGRAIDATHSAIEHLGYIQIDTISVIQRAHHHTLWNRNPRYQHKHLDQLVQDNKVFEYWSHAAAYLPMSNYRFSLQRKNAYTNGELKHWYPRNEKVINSVIERITSEGPLMAKDFDDKSKQKSGDWKSKPSKQALEYLFMQGDLMISSRNNFHKVYDLTERVLPTTINTTVPSQDEHTRFLITQYLKANGIGQASEIAYLLKNTKPNVIAALNEMKSNGEILEINVVNQIYYVSQKSLELLNKPLARSKLKILSPFDNLLIQRKRMNDLFDYNYLIECYVPEKKRQYGYFSLPILWDGKLVARMDCKVEKSKSLLHINHLALEDIAINKEAFYLALNKELEVFLKFNNCLQYQVHRTTPTSFLSLFKA